MQFRYLCGYSIIEIKIMKWFRYVFIALLYCLMGIGLGHADTSVQKRKKSTKRTAVQKRSGKRKANGRSRAKHRGSKSNRQVSMQASRKANMEAVRQERRHLDSLRLHNGGTLPLKTSEELLPVDIEPLMTRFRRGDTTLRSEQISSLYYSNRLKDASEQRFLADIEVEADRNIEASRYEDALRSVRCGLFRNPMHIPLLKRACDLAQHLGDEEVDIYIWQIVELLVAIDSSGDGTTPERAYNTMGVSDAILFETLWLETPREHIKRRPSVTEEHNKSLLTLEVSHNGKTKLRYYRVPAGIQGK